MKILVLNCGSSSIKYKLFQMSTKKVLAQGGIEKIGMDDSFLKITLSSDEKVILKKTIQEHTAGIEFILEMLTDSKYGCLQSLNEIDAVGHRIVHGGEKFNQSVIITQEVIDKVKACVDIAPLHNPANLIGIRACQELMPNVPMVAVFDTAFHQTMPDVAYTYALPYEYYEKYAVRRYGFHGTSHSYVSKRAADVLGKDYSELKTIVCHLGNGASICAVKNGKSVDTSMGLTPLEGLIMGTRSGDVDPSILDFIAQKENLTLSEVMNVLNKKSGVEGISGVSSDFRDLAAAAEEGNDRARLALDAFVYRVVKYIGAYAAAMNGVDVICFTAGCGENDVTTRGKIVRAIEYLGITLDEEANKAARGEEGVISTADSKVTVLAVPTNEELAICRETVALV